MIMSEYLEILCKVWLFILPRLLKMKGLSPGLPLLMRREATQLLTPHLQMIIFLMSENALDLI